MIVQEGQHFNVFKNVRGYKKEYAELCKHPADMVYLGRRTTIESAERLLNENSDRP